MVTRVIGLAEWQPRDKGRAVLKIALDLEDEWPLLIRRVLYVAYEAGLYDDKGKNSYDSVGNFLGRARRAGLLPWKAVAEVTDRAYAEPYDEPGDFVAEMRRQAARYRLDRQAGQAAYLIAWSEHRGLKVTLGEVADEYGVPFIAAGGFDTTTVRYVEAYAAMLREVPTVVLHFGDRDKAGEDITAVLQRDLDALYTDIIRKGDDSDLYPLPPVVVRIALTAEQVEHYRLAEPGEDVQVDALPTPVLREMLREAIEARQDPDVLAATLAREATERQQVKALVESLIDPSPPA